MAEVFRALQDEPLDALLWREVGRTDGVVEAVLDANPGLARIAHALPEGHEVLVPAAAREVRRQSVVQLWD